MTVISALPQHLQLRLRDEMKAGEMLVWVGQPDPGRYMRSGFLLWLFFIPWTAFSIFWIAGAANFKVLNFDDGWSYFPFFGLPFMLVGLGGLSAPLWLRRKAKTTIYAITDRRAMSIEGAKTIKVKSFLAGDIAQIEKTQHPDGSGDLVLRTERYRDSDGDQRTRQDGFFAIPDVRQVERLVENLFRNTQFTKRM